MNGAAGAALAAALWVAFATLARAEVQPAELPPADYRGLQYVDSRGCAFLKAGTEERPTWVLRVTAGGAPICGNPPSGQRVPIAGEAGAETAGSKSDNLAEVAPEATPIPTESTQTLATGGYIVAIGSFAVAGNADSSLARLTELGYPAASGWLQGGSSGLITVYAGPYASKADADAARTALRGAGFPDAVLLSF